ncbi:MAG: DUF2202 domain-containing protein [Gemmatimonadetes bacterium]|nr:DUF2202 domain-containing protein [Gemmatimonadota bacterium]MBT8478729.1 DUF2202 domain-containing protein [Gemmatimonadota bacterium]NNK49488.1 DUF2202 domain-containing protein [Gemmatimonadota bacterium]
MFRTHIAVKATVAFLIMLLLSVAGCDGEPEAMGPVVDLPAEYAPTSTEVLQLLDTALASETMAYFTYLHAAAAFDRPFTHIGDAELRHVEAVQRLYVKRGMEAPDFVEPDGVPTYDARILACQAGVASEIAVVELYDELIPLSPPDVARVLARLREVSGDNHLQAFLGCS